MNPFQELGISESILPALQALGYESPSPIQVKSIPILLEGRDILAQAQTGTGKTAAFALPILTRLKLKQRRPQALILAPTRELAIQVAEAFQSFAKDIPSFKVLPIYGGQDYRTQLRALKDGVHVIVGTPGRVMDHLRRGTLKTEHLSTIVLDEADEMLRMGFAEDVQWILQQIPGEHQTALFSATIPDPIKRIANRYLKDAAKIHIKSEVKTVAAISQSYTLVSKNHKLEALTRFLEVEDVEAAIIFTRTKIGSAEIAEKLETRGFSVAAINGDMSQALREKVIKRLKNKSLQFVVATEVAARGLDVEHISHVINYDIPDDAESYIHRIGRTGRAGREGKAILLVTPNERRLLNTIERGINQPLKRLEPPTINQINKKRIRQFKSEIMKILDNQELDYYRNLLEDIIDTSEKSELDIAAALAFLVQKSKPLERKEDRSISLGDQNFNDSPRNGKPRRQRRGGGGGNGSRSGENSGRRRKRYYQH